MRQIGILAAVLAVAIGIVVAAVQANGRTDVRADTNDGGAWLIRRSTGVVGHLNRAVGEVSGTVSVATPGAEFDVEESGSTIAVLDRSSNRVSLVDGRTFQIVNDFDVAADSHLALFEHDGHEGGVVWTQNPLKVWRLDSAHMTDLESVDSLETLVETEDAGLVSVTTEGSVWVVDSASGKAAHIDADTDGVTWIDVADVAKQAAAVSAIGESAVIAPAEGASLVVLSPGGDQRTIAGAPVGSTLAIPGPAGSPVAAISEVGAVLVADGSATEMSKVGDAGGASPVEPIFYRGCVFAVATQPPTFSRTCGGATDQTVPLEGSTGSALRLRLVNGWIWVNDLDSGALWVTTTEGPVDRIDDWGDDLDDADNGNDDSDDTGSAAEQRDNPDSVDASFTKADEIDQDGINEPPVAHDDQARTRVDRPVVVDVLTNDTDPDGDVLLVTDVSGVSDGAIVSPTADRRAVQVEPAPGLTGAISFGYSITDGRGGSAEAQVTVQVAPNDGSDNRPPVPVTDVAETRAGSTASLNVLANDSDPDGDGLILQSASSDSGTVVFDPSGQVTFTADPASSAGVAAASYVVADTFGAVATGSIRVEIRLETSNNEPDARNDSAVTVVDKPVALNVLDNDTDPDNDPLTVAGPPTLVIPEGIDINSLEMSLSPDGQFFFSPEAAGTFLFRYSIIDGSESDSAVIRIDVDAAIDNRPPIAVRDDVTVSRGGTKTVYVLQNDADPDGDVIALTGWSAADGIEIEELQGIGFRVTAKPDAPSEVQFRYSISDGRSDPVSGAVVVSISSVASVDQAPVARPDTIEVRRGHTTSVHVLANDYDPEGSPIKVAGVAATPSATLRIGPGAQEIFVGVDATATASFSFGYDIVDAAGNRTASQVLVRLVPADQANRAPVARSDIARTRSGLAVSIPVLANDTDPDGDAIRLESISSQPAVGVAAANPDGSITYTADADHSGTDRLRYVVVDAFGDRSIGEVLIGIMPPGGDNLPPSAADDTYTVLAGSDPIALDVLTNDWDGDGDPLSITRVSGNTEIAVDDARRNLVFSPPATIEVEAQTSTLVYSISDGRGGTDDGTVTIEVVAALVPVAPVAVDDVIGPVHANETANADVLANDIDPDGARASLVASSLDPAVVFAADHTAAITSGTATSEHMYTVTDPSGLTADALITVIVADNLAPTATTINVETPAGQPLTVDIGAQVQDPDGDPLFFACCDGVRHGSATTTASAAGVLSVEYLPDTDFAGMAGFSYTVDDQHGHVASGAVAVKVLASANRAPVATDATGEIEAGTVGAASLSGFVSDPDTGAGDQLAYQLIDPPARVTIEGETVRVDAPIDAGGSTISTRYRVTDRAGEGAEAALTISVMPSKAAPPTAVADNARTTQGVPVSLDVVANDVDPLGRGLAVIAAGATDGSTSVSVGSDGHTLNVTPGPEFFGTAQISYTVQDARNTPDGQAVGQLSVDVIGLPGTPPTPQATASNATATVFWTQPAANGSPLDAIEIESDQVPVRDIGSVSSYTYTGLVNGVPHSFRVRAHNEAGWGPWSAYSAPVTPDTQPGRPAAPSVTFGDGALTVTWAAPPNQGSAITGYDLEIGGGASQVAQLGNLLQYTWTGLANGTSYQFRVTAVNAAGRSEVSSWSTTEHPLREPAAPGTPVVTQGDRYLDLAWTKAADNGDPIIEYQLERASNPGALVPATGTSMRWSDLPNGVEQQFRVRARNRDVDWGAWSAWSSPVKPCGVPDTPAAPTAARGDGSAVVSFSAPGSQGCDIDQYQVDANGGAVQAASGSPHTFTGLTNGTAYTFRVRAHNSVGWSAWSGPSGAVVPAGNPIGPTSINATPVAPGTVDLSWAAANPNGAGITTYQVSVNDGATRDVGNVTSYRYAGLGNGTSYSFKVRACNDTGCGAFSASRSATTWGEPSQPNNPNLNPGDATLSATWSAPAANGSPINGYDVELDPGSVSNNSDTSKTWNGLNNGTTYRVRVRACNAVGCGAWSGWSSATPRANVDVRISKGPSAVGLPGCSTSSCAWVDVVATGLTANQDYVVTCHGETGGAYSATTVRSDGNGRLTDRACYYGYPNTDFYVTVGSHESNHIRW